MNEQLNRQRSTVIISFGNVDNKSLHVLFEKSAMPPGAACAKEFQLKIYNLPQSSYCHHNDQISVIERLSYNLQFHHHHSNIHTIDQLSSQSMGLRKPPYWSANQLFIIVAPLIIGLQDARTPGTTTIQISVIERLSHNLQFHHHHSNIHTIDQLSSQSMGLRKPPYWSANQLFVIVAPPIIGLQDARTPGTTTIQISVIERLSYYLQFHHHHSNIHTIDQLSLQSMCRRAHPRPSPVFVVVGYLA